MQKCCVCGLCVHEVCYGLFNPKPEKKYKYWKCHACKAVGKRILVSKHGEGKNKYICIRKRPTDCVLCSIKTKNHAMHMLYDKEGSGGRPQVLKANPKKGLPERIAWVHTLCANYLAGKGFVWGFDQEKLNSNPQYNHQDDDEGDESGNVMNISPQYYTMVTETNGNKNTFNEIKEFRNGLKCGICKHKDNIFGCRRIAVQCNAGDSSEFEEFKPCHVKLQNKPCTIAFHVGCARWTQTSHKRVFYYPGFNDATESSNKFSEPVRAVYCGQHSTTLSIFLSKKKASGTDTEQKSSSSATKPLHHIVKHEDVPLQHLCSDILKREDREIRVNKYDNNSIEDQKKNNNKFIHEKNFNIHEQKQIILGNDANNPIEVLDNDDNCYQNKVSAREETSENVALIQEDSARSTEMIDFSQTDKQSQMQMHENNQIDFVFPNGNDSEINNGWSISKGWSKMCGKQFKGDNKDVQKTIYTHDAHPKSNGISQKIDLKAHKEPVSMMENSWEKQDCLGKFKGWDKTAGQKLLFSTAPKQTLSNNRTDSENIGNSKECEKIREEGINAHNEDVEFPLKSSDTNLCTKQVKDKSNQRMRNSKEIETSISDSSPLIQISQGKRKAAYTSFCDNALKSDDSIQKVYLESNIKNGNAELLDKNDNSLPKKVDKTNTNLHNSNEWGKVFEQSKDITVRNMHNRFHKKGNGMESRFEQQETADNIEEKDKQMISKPDLFCSEANTKLSSIVGTDGIVLVKGDNDHRRNVVHIPWPARITSLDECEYYIQGERKIGRKIMTNQVCILYYYPCWEKISDMSGNRFFDVDFVNESQIYQFSTNEVNVNKYSQEIQQRFKEALTVGKGLQKWAKQNNFVAPCKRKKHRFIVNPIHQIVGDYGLILTIPSDQWINSAQNLDCNEVVDLINSKTEQSKTFMGNVDPSKPHSKQSNAHKSHSNRKVKEKRHNTSSSVQKKICLENPRCSNDEKQIEHLSKEGNIEHHPISTRKINHDLFNVLDETKRHQYAANGDYYSQPHIKSEDEESGSAISTKMTYAILYKGLGSELLNQCSSTSQCKKIFEALRDIPPKDVKTDIDVGILLEIVAKMGAHIIKLEKDGAQNLNLRLV
eukprot:CAMPEP_0184873510 /NCGR_PEP_ID=MMETSP0580-20130426/41882_1 /TAXON_ID=1118495 /ORGANISM="Dactyliosolen fragilissimus" /LENGTH=1107 /DNA_ID=CAMNT_0027376425 /DNA_START=146 /DNA_END=3469 /DNA_ORIENTATION=+